MTWACRCQTHFKACATLLVAAAGSLTGMAASAKSIALQLEEWLGHASAQRSASGAPRCLW